MSTGMTSAVPTGTADSLVVHANRTPNKVALIDAGGGSKTMRWTFLELTDWAQRLASALVALGLEPGEAAAWYGPNSGYLVAIVHALRLAGLAAVPVNYRLAPPEVAYVLKDSGAKAVFVDTAMLEMYERAMKDSVPPKFQFVFSPDAPLGERFQYGGLMLDCNRVTLEAPAINLGDRYRESTVITYTSGTTGRPKGAERREVGDQYRAETSAALGRLIGYCADDVYITTGPMYHSGPGGWLRMAHRYGQTVVVQRRFDPAKWLGLVESYGVTSTFSAPTPIRMICDLDDDIKVKYDRSTMRIMVANAAPWPLTLKRRYLADFPPESLWEVYGSTELGITTVLEPCDQLRKPGSCGKPAPGVLIRLFGEDGKEITESNVPGEIYVRAANVFAGYYGKPEATRKAKRDGFTSVGDIGYWDDEGYLYISDRKADMIISGGMNVYSIEVEAALAAYPDVSEAAVYGLPDEEWGEAVHADVVAKPGSALERGEADALANLTAFLRQELANYKMPKVVNVVAELPKTGSGKVLKRKIREEARLRQNEARRSN